MKALEKKQFRASSEICLGTVDRMISFNNLKVDHLSKQRMGHIRGGTPGLQSATFCGILLLNFDYIPPKHALA